MIITFAIETILVVYVLFRYRRTAVVWLSAAILTGLATFQLAEFNVCTGAKGLLWAQIGYVAITLLPPLGLHLAMQLAGRLYRWLLAAAYGSAALFLVAFLFAAQAINGQECLGNYVIFDIASWLTWPYVAYYYGWLLVTVFFAWQSGRMLKNQWKRRSLYALLVGYLLFMVPTTIANIADPTTIAGIPSIMCGFAVLLALILVVLVLPWYHKKGRLKQKK